MNTKISIVIPCYNSEVTLEATLESVLNQDLQEWEAIIVNDGSTDATEEIALKWARKDKRFKYFSKKNEGLGKTRNFAIKEAEGIYILPLDSDNLVEKYFTNDALKVFENNPDVGVVYGNAEYFGEREGIWIVDEYKFEKMLVHNYIDACAIYKKEIWEKVDGYEEQMPHQGHEDWAFWVAFGVLKVKFFHLGKVTFKYYVSNTSMIRSFTNEMVEANQDYIVKKYSKQYHLEYCNAMSLAQSIEDKYESKLNSRKFIINLFAKKFFRFKVFKAK